MDLLMRWAAHLWRWVRALLDWIDRRPPLRRIRAWMARQPPALALAMFLVPEITSRAGTLLSAWLLLHGHTRQALTVYVGSKISAGLIALWVYSACQPALLRIPWFARCHAGMVQLRAAALAWLRRH